VLQVRPIIFRDASKYVREYHRHSAPARGCKFAISITDGEKLRGVATCGRPCRLLQDGVTAEITRVCTDGVRNGCTLLYATCIKILRLMGYRRIVTYTRADETGHTLKLSGFKAVARVRAEQYSRPSRPRRLREPHEMVERVRWEWVAQ
jgi:hypothetical protein